MSLILILNIELKLSQPALFTCLKSTMETQGQCAKFVQSQQ